MVNTALTHFKRWPIARPPFLLQVCTTFEKAPMAILEVTAGA
jgi:hypothetical protein